MKIEHNAVCVAFKYTFKFELFYIFKFIVNRIH